MPGQHWITGSGTIMNKSNVQESVYVCMFICPYVTEHIIM